MCEESGTERPDQDQDVGSIDRSLKTAELEKRNLEINALKADAELRDTKKSKRAKTVMGILTPILTAALALAAAYVELRSVRSEREAVRTQREELERAQRLSAQKAFLQRIREDLKEGAPEEDMLNSVRLLSAFDPNLVRTQISRLGEIFEEKSGDLAEAARYALKKQAGPDVSQELGRRLSDLRHRKASDALEIIGLDGSEEAADVLLRSLDEDDPRVSGRAKALMARVHSGTLLERLPDLIAEDSRKKGAIADAAIDALYLVEDRQAVHRAVSRLVLDEWESHYHLFRTPRLLRLMAGGRLSMKQRKALRGVYEDPNIDLSVHEKIFAAALMDDRTGWRSPQVRSLLEDPSSASSWNAEPILATWQWLVHEGMESEAGTLVRNRLRWISQDPNPSYWKEETSFLLEARVPEVAELNETFVAAQDPNAKFLLAWHLMRENSDPAEEWLHSGGMPLGAKILLLSRSPSEAQRSEGLLLWIREDLDELDMTSKDGELEIASNLIESGERWLLRETLARSLSEEEKAGLGGVAERGLPRNARRAAQMLKPGSVPAVSRLVEQWCSAPEEREVAIWCVLHDGEPKRREVSLHFLIDRAPALQAEVAFAVAARFLGTPLERAAMGFAFRSIDSSESAGFAILHEPAIWSLVDVLSGGRSDLWRRAGVSEQLAAELLVGLWATRHVRG